MDCPHCHGFIDAGADICPACGRDPKGVVAGGGATAVAVAQQSQRVSPAALALLALTMACAAAMLGVFAAGYEGQSGALLLVTIIGFAAYLSLPAARRHPAVDQVWQRFDRRIDEATDVFVRRTDLRRGLRAEQRRLAAMRAERQRRIEALGEHAYRFMRTREVTDTFRTAAVRVRRIESQMVAQEARIDELRRRLTS